MGSCCNKLPQEVKYTTTSHQEIDIEDETSSDDIDNHDDHENGADIKHDHDYNETTICSTCISSTPASVSLLQESKQINPSKQKFLIIGYTKKYTLTKMDINTFRNITNVIFHFYGNSNNNDDHDVISINDDIDSTIHKLSRSHYRSRNRSSINKLCKTKSTSTTSEPQSLSLSQSGRSFDFVNDDIITNNHNNNNKEIDNDNNDIMIIKPNDNNQQTHIVTNDNDEEQEEHEEDEESVSTTDHSTDSTPNIARTCSYTEEKKLTTLKPPSISIPSMSSKREKFVRSPGSSRSSTNKYKFKRITVATTGTTSTGRPRNGSITSPGFNNNTHNMYMSHHVMIKKREKFVRTSPSHKTKTRTSVRTVNTPSSSSHRGIEHIERSKTGSSSSSSSSSSSPSGSASASSSSSSVSSASTASSASGYGSGSGSSYYSSTSSDNEHDGWNGYKRNLRLIFYCYSGYLSRKNYLTRKQLIRFIEIVEINKFWTLNEIINDNITFDEFMDHLNQENIKKHLEKQLSWQLLIKAVNVFDLNNDGFDGKLDYKQFIEFGKAFNINDNETKTLWKTIDINNDDIVTVDELFSWFKQKLELQQQKIRIAIKRSKIGDFSGSHSSFFDDESSETESRLSYVGSTSSVSRFTVNKNELNNKLIT